MNNWGSVGPKRQCGLLRQSTRTKFYRLWIDDEREPGKFFLVIAGRDGWPGVDSAPRVLAELTAEEADDLSGGAVSKLWRKGRR